MVSDVGNGSNCDFHRATMTDMLRNAGREQHKNRERSTEPEPEIRIAEAISHRVLVLFPNRTIIRVGRIDLPRGTFIPSVSLRSLSGQSTVLANCSGKRHGQNEN